MFAGWGKGLLIREGAMTEDDDWKWASTIGITYKRFYILVSFFILKFNRIDDEHFMLTDSDVGCILSIDWCAICRKKDHKQGSK
jgi:hypothetical protein